MQGQFAVVFSRIEERVSHSLMAPRRLMIDPFLESALEVGEALRTAAKAHLLAQIVPPSPADTTLPTRDADLERYAVADSEAAAITHLVADGDHHA